MKYNIYTNPQTREIFFDSPKIKNLAAFDHVTETIYNTLAILNTHKELTDKICFVKIGNVFVESQTKRWKIMIKL